MNDDNITVVTNWLQVCDQDFYVKGCEGYWFPTGTNATGVGITQKNNAMTPACVREVVSLW